MSEAISSQLSAVSSQLADFADRRWLWLKGGNIEGLQKLEGLAKSVSVDSEHLQSYPDIPERRVVRPYKPNASGCGFGGSEYR
ncbi:MAG TPA: hypothetical protein VMT20_10105 [Terriglobia bacterium]|nr:hypothetical protein [Terriglobia bacterium]